MCDSAQGFANGVLFCVCTKAVRQRLLKAAKRCFCCQCVGCCSSCKRSQQLEYESTTEEPDLLAGNNEGVQLVDSSSYTSSYNTCVQSLEINYLMSQWCFCTKNGLETPPNTCSEQLVTLQYFLCGCLLQLVFCIIMETNWGGTQTNLLFANSFWKPTCVLGSLCHCTFLIYMWRYLSPIQWQSDTT